MATLRIGRPDGRHSGWETLAPLMWVLIVGLVVLYAFFVALGAFSPWDVAPVSALVAVLVALYAVHAWREAHRPDGSDPELQRARERRGF